MCFLKISCMIVSMNKIARISQTQAGSVHLAIIIILVIALLAGLGFIFWKNSAMQTSSSSASPEVSQPTVNEEFCVSTDGLIEKDGIFCSESIGIQFKVPDEFIGKFAKAKNYDVTKGEMGGEQVSAGKSLEVYEAKIAVGDEEDLSLSVAKEPLRNGYSSIGHMLQRTYFNATTKELTLVYGGEVTSFYIDGVKIYKGSIGDAGSTENGYLSVVKDNLVVVRIKHSINPMEDSIIDFEKIFDSFDNNLQSVKFAEKS